MQRVSWQYSWLYVLDYMVGFGLALDGREKLINGETEFSATGNE